MIKIYGAVASRMLRSLWAIEELGVPYEHEEISVKDGSNRSPHYLAINPAGRVPALVDGDALVTESLAINLYLAQQYGAGSLWPSDKAGQASTLRWTLWAASDLDPVIGFLYNQLFVRAEADRDAAGVHAATLGLATNFALIDQALQSRDYLAGDSFTVADLNVAVFIASFRGMGLDLSPFANLRQWLEACLARPAKMKIDALPK